jgi:hypothetical protein
MMTMSLREKILARKPISETVAIDGDTFKIVGKSKRDRAAIFARARKKDGSLDFARLESLLLAACVFDPETDQQLIDDHALWESVDAALTGPLLSHVMRIIGMDKQDVQSPKDSDTTET